MYQSYDEALCWPEGVGVDHNRHEGCERDRSTRLCENGRFQNGERKGHRNANACECHFLGAGTGFAKPADERNERKQGDNAADRDPFHNFGGFFADRK